jgi:diaminopimelate epimerase
MQKLIVYKIQGCGNSFIICNKNALMALTNPVGTKDVSRLSVTDPDVSFRSLISTICSRGLGLGSDGMMVVGDVEYRDDQKFCEVLMYNPDGSWMGMCGNGIRCVTRYLALTELISDDHLETVHFSIGGRRIICNTKNGGRLVSVDMGEPVLDMSALPAQIANGELLTEVKAQDRVFKGTAVGMGNPHFVIFEAIDELEHWGPLLENHSIFPERANIEFVILENKNKVRVAVWERDAGITAACGTGACAVVVAGVLNLKTDRDVVVQLPGGDLIVNWKEEDNHVYMTGNAHEIACATLYL